MTGYSLEEIMLMEVNDFHPKEQLQFVKDKSHIFTRSSNEHRSFVPSNCYPTKDGFVYLAIGNDLQWEKLTQIDGFAHLEKPIRKTNNGRKEDREEIYADIRQGLQQYTTLQFIQICLERNLAVAPVNSTQQVAELDYIKESMIKTQLPVTSNSSGISGEVALFPAPMNTEFLARNNNRLSCAPRLGEHTESILAETGLTTEEIAMFVKDGVL